MEIVLANPRGFCAGVDRAIAIVNRALECFNPPIYVRHEVVHNKFVVDDLRQRGAVFVDELDQVPDDSIVIFSAHGVSKAVQQEAERRGLKVFDATCPLVTKVHIEVTKYAREGTEAILIGHEGHPEVEGTMGQYDKLKGGDIYLVEDEEEHHGHHVRHHGHRLPCATWQDGSFHSLPRWGHRDRQLHHVVGDRGPRIRYRRRCHPVRRADDPR